MSATLRLPPKIKILEALSAVCGGRVHVVSDSECRVISSDGSRAYVVHVDLRRGVAYSNDNGTTYRNYVGYPIIAFLMVKSVLPVDCRIGDAIKDVPWRKLNEMYRSYDKVMSYVMRVAKERGVSEQSITTYVSQVMRRLASLRLVKLESPPR